MVATHFQNPRRLCMKKFIPLFQIYIIVFLLTVSIFAFPYIWKGIALSSTIVSTLYLTIAYLRYVKQELVSRNISRIVQLNSTIDTFVKISKLGKLSKDTDLIIMSINDSIKKIRNNHSLFKELLLKHEVSEIEANITNIASTICLELLYLNDIDSKNSDLFNQVFDGITESYHLLDPVIVNTLSVPYFESASRKYKTAKQLNNDTNDSIFIKLKIYELLIEADLDLLEGYNFCKTPREEYYNNIIFFADAQNNS